MDDFSQNVNENGEKDDKVTVPEESGTDDILFEDSFDIEKLLKTLQENPEIEAPKEPGNTDTPSLPVASKDKDAKKYVIYVNPDNVNFMEGLSIPERRNIINKILKEQNEITIKKKIFEAKKRKIINVILAFITITICLPIFFALINKATTITFANYKEAKNNFSRLYQPKGKIPRTDISSDETIKY